MSECLPSVDKSPALILQEGRERPKRGKRGSQRRGREEEREGETGFFLSQMVSDIQMTNNVQKRLQLINHWGILKSVCINNVCTHAGANLSC